MFTMLTVIFLSACSSKENQHMTLHQYINKVKQRPAGAIEPLPAFETHVPFTYSSEHRRDPFRPVKQKVNHGAPSEHRNKEALESFPLDSLRMVGTVRRNNTLWALVAANNGNIYRVTVGNHMGQNYGKIQAITHQSIRLQEMIFTEDEGWIKHNTTISLSNLGNKQP